MSKLALLAALLLALPAFGQDLVVTKDKHSDAMKLPGHEQPAQDTREVTWVGTDRMRVEEGDQITLVRADLKKLYMLDTKTKSYTALDLPLDMKKYMPPEMAPMITQMASQAKATLTPTTETKEIQGWTATRTTLSMTMPMGGAMTEELWVVKDVGVDLGSWRTMASEMMALNPFAGGMAAEMKKLDGFPVLVERTQKMMGTEMKERETVISIEKKTAPEGWYDLPAGYTEKPFDPMEGMGGPPAHRDR
jgi:hypothetical protein